MDVQDRRQRHPGGGPGRHHAKGSTLLPDPATTAAETASAAIDDEHRGRVRIHYRRVKMRHHQHTHWAWVAYRADPAP